MGLFSNLKKQFSNVIEWRKTSLDIIWQKFESDDDAIINSSKLILEPGQGVVLVYEGKLDGILTEEGIYNLKTDNHPFITTLTKVRQLFESEHKLKLYFFRTAKVLAQNWGTSNWIKYVDPIYNFPIQMGMHGNFGYKIVDVNVFYREIVSSQDVFYSDDINELILAKIPTIITQFIAQKKLPYNEIDSNLLTISEEMKPMLNDAFGNLGLEILEFNIIANQFDENTQKEISKFTDASGDLNIAQKLGLSYVELEKIRAMRDAAKNEGLAGAGLQMGVGMELGKNIMNQTDKLLESNPDIADKLKTLQILLNENIISQEDFDTKKKELLARL